MKRVLIYKSLNSKITNDTFKILVVSRFRGSSGTTDYWLLMDSGGLGLDSHHFHLYNNGDPTRLLMDISKPFDTQLILSKFTFQISKQ